MRLYGRIILDQGENMAEVSEPGEFIRGYNEGREIGFAEGYKAGLNAARYQLEQMPQTPEIDGWLSPPAQEVAAELPLSTGIEELDLGVRTYNCLKRMKLNTVGDVMQRTVAWLQGAGNPGKVVLTAENADELKAALSSFGYTLRDDDGAPSQ